MVPVAMRLSPASAPGACPVDSPSCRRMRRRCAIADRLAIVAASHGQNGGSTAGDRHSCEFLRPGVRAPSRVAGMASVPLPGFEGLLGKIECGQRIWFCDGRLEFVAETPQSDGLIASLERGEIPLKSYNSICLPDTNGAFTMITAEDDDLLRDFSAAGLTPDWVALSMVSSAGDVEIGRNGLSRHSLNGARVMAKIETAAAVRRDGFDPIGGRRHYGGARATWGRPWNSSACPRYKRSSCSGAAGRKVVGVATQILEPSPKWACRALRVVGLSLLAFRGPT